MSRYAILRSFIEDEEEIAAFERAEEDYQESEDINAPYEELERVIAEDRRWHDQEAEQFLTADYYRQNPDALSWAIFRRHQEQHPEEYEHIRYEEPAEEDPRAEDEEIAGESRAARLAEEVLAEAYAEEPAEMKIELKTPITGTPLPMQARQQTKNDPTRARFINDWDEWSSTLSVQFSQFQLCAIFLSLFRPPVDHWAEQRLLQIRQWQDKGMTDDDDALLEDIIGRFMEEFVPRDDAREEYVGDAAENPENPDDWETVDDGESTDDGEVPPPPSLCRDDSQDSEEEPGEAEEYGCQDEVDSDGKVQSELWCEPEPT
ncbi:hypothetical protein EDB86DRAFT_3140734 [Lactarius hatsudake]|nr:hypothetical protein EDB86DRAFT_3140734 [Lactarius hatsudake]